MIYDLLLPEIIGQQVQPHSSKTCENIDTVLVVVKVIGKLLYSRATLQKGRIGRDRSNIWLEVFSAIEEHLGIVVFIRLPERSYYVGYWMMVRVAKLHESHYGAWK